MPGCPQSGGHAKANNREESDVRRRLTRDEQSAVNALLDALRNGRSIEGLHPGREVWHIAMNSTTYGVTRADIDALLEAMAALIRARL